MRRGVIIKFKLFSLLICILVIFLIIGYRTRHVKVKLFAKYKEAIKTYALIKDMSDDQKIKVVTYNIRHGKGTDNKINLDRIVNVLKKIDADIIVLNEVDNYMLRTGMKKQDEIIAQKLGYNVAYAPNVNYIGKSGNAILTKYPIISCNNYILPVLNKAFSEPRGLIEVKINVMNEIITIMGTHLSLNVQERKKQINFIKTKLNNISGKKILMGDFNDKKTSDSIKIISEFMKDSTQHEYNTFPSDNPYTRIDYIFVSPQIRIVDSKSIKTNGSDHLPAVAEIKLGT